MRCGFCLNRLGEGERRLRRGGWTANVAYATDVRSKKRGTARTRVPEMDWSEWRYGRLGLPIAMGWAAGESSTNSMPLHAAMRVARHCTSPRPQKGRLGTQVDDALCFAVSAVGWAVAVMTGPLGWFLLCHVWHNNGLASSDPPGADHCSPMNPHPAGNMFRYDKVFQGDGAMGLKPRSWARMSRCSRLAGSISRFTRSTRSTRFTVST